MATRPPEIYGINISEIARICHVSMKTAMRWKQGKTCPPKSALMLLAGDLGCLDSEWAGWRVHKGVLYSREGWEIKVNDVLAMPLIRAQLEAYKTAERQVLTMHEQPAPDSWSEDVLRQFG